MSLIDALPNLTPAIARHTLYILTGALPPPLSELPEERAARDEAAITAVADLRPIDAYEARLAARSVAADAYAMDCFRLAGESGRDPDAARRCRAEANAMSRVAESALRSLHRMQASRAKPEAALILAEGQPQIRHRAPEPVAAKPQPPRQVNPPLPDLATEADDYALHHRKNAILIRRLGRLPERRNLWLRPELVHAIVTGTSPILRALDHPADKARMAA